MPVDLPAVDSPPPPKLSNDRSFLGMLTTQFLGAFNDNLFKQLVLLICVDLVQQGGPAKDSTALALFAIPFILFSGFAGWLADRTSKRRIIVLMKACEVVIMLAGLAAFFVAGDQLGTQLNFLLPVLFLMGTHSAFFGPSKYGILPEMLPKEKLPEANGLIQMTTFLAIIFGMALAGYAKDWLADRLWVISGICVGIAVVGVLTALFVRPTPVARPGLPFHVNSLLIDSETWRLLRTDAALRNVLLVSSLFWFLGGVVQPNVNSFGRFVLGLSDSRTSLAAACMGIGIAVGCLVAAKVSHGGVRFAQVRLGAWGIVASLASLTILGTRAASVPLVKAGGAESLTALLLPSEPWELQTRIVLILLGLFSGLFVVPLQVFLQTRPPASLKGRMIGAMNLTNWVGIFLSAVFLLATTAGLSALKIDVVNVRDVVIQRNSHWVFAILSAMMLPVALFFRPPAFENEPITQPAASS